MKYLFRPIFALAIVALLSATSTQANNEEKMIIALHTDGNELVNADISELAIGEAKTIETDDGTVIDILRTVDGAELYVDGELLEMDFDAEGMHGDHMIKRHVEIFCEDDENCNETEFIIADSDVDIEKIHELHEGGDGHKVMVIRKKIITEN